LTHFEAIQKHYQNRDLAARDWKKKGGKVAGYFCDNVPEELILAAGFFPLRLSGNPDVSLKAETEYSFVLAHQEGFVGSMVSMLLNGKFDFLDYLVIPHARESVQILYPFLLNLKKSRPALKLPEIYYLDNLHTTFYSAGLYNRDQTIRFLNKLEEWSGKKISDESLSRAIAVGNENKTLLKKVASLRAADPPRISGVEALQLIGSSMFILKEEHNKLLKQFLGKSDILPPRDGVRLFVEGSPLDNLQLYELIESCGAIVVGEDNCWGNRYADVPIDTSLEPVEAIIDRYLRKSPCPRMYPMSRRVNYCVENAVNVKAQGVIINVLEYDSVQTWEVPSMMQKSKEAGIPCLHLKRQPYHIKGAAALKSTLTGFIGDIKNSISR
jgi:benzoyl-CoA reductase/2-hydroxyglutaryl-CoA dehydratase subunit BcrC/BadD/HgdB